MRSVVLSFITRAITITTSRFVVLQMVIHAQNVETYTRTRKAYEDTKENSMEMMYIISHFLCRKCSISIAYIYCEDVE